MLGIETLPVLKGITAIRGVIHSCPQRTSWEPDMSLEMVFCAEWTQPRSSPKSIRSNEGYRAETGKRRKEHIITKRDKAYEGKEQVKMTAKGGGLCNQGEQKK